MKKTFAFCLLVAIGLGLLTPRLNSGAQNEPEAATKRAAAYFFYWYRNPDRHFIDPDGSDALTDHPPDEYLVAPPQYSYADAGWHYRELLDLMAAQIEVILPVYWGNDSEKYWSQTGLTKLVEAEDQLISEGKNPPKIGMFFDTTALKIQNGNIPADLTTTAGKQMFYQMIHDFFIRVPDTGMWAKMDGKPIIYLYVSAYVSAYNQSTFQYISDQFLAEFGVRPYVVKELSWTGVTTDGAYAWGTAVNGPYISSELASIGPGYDESAVQGRVPPLIRGRDCGEFYQDSWEQVIDSAATFTAVETWNEYHEGTDIAASREYARQYIELNAKNVLAWKANDVTERPYAWIDLGQYPYIRGIQAPNGGDGTWKSKYLNGRQAAFPDLLSSPDPSFHIYLNVDDAFVLGQDHTPTHVWVTVEYLDLSTDHWFLQYDSTAGDDLEDIFKVAGTVTLQNTGQWKQVTFDLPDAYFANRQQGGLADLRLVDAYDGTTNYFGRVWVFKSNPSALHAPNLTGLNDQYLLTGRASEVTFSTSDPGGGVLSVSLDRAPEWVSLIDHHNGTFTLRFEPEEGDSSKCSYRVRVLVSDATNPALVDVETISVRVFSHPVYLPMVRR